MFHFTNGRERRPRATVETTQRIASPPHRGVAREAVTIVVDGVEHALEVIRREKIHGSQAFWICPQCAMPRWHLYARGNEIACRQCLRLTYESKRTKNPAPLRTRRLRRKLGGPLMPFSPLPKRPKHWRRDYWMRSITELLATERVLAARLHDMVRR